MKRYIVLFALLLFALSLTVAQDETKQCRINVKGMMCGGCASQVKNACLKLDGVTDAKVSLADGVAEVTYASSKLSPNDLVAAIEKTGFSAALIEEQKKAEKKEMGGEMKMVTSPEMDSVRAQLKAAKLKLAQEGHYSCCNAPACDFCAISMNMCPCGMNVKEGKPVCGECADGWSVGHGNVSGVDPKKVKREPHDMLKMGYDMKAKMFGEMKEEKK